MLAHKGQFNEDAEQQIQEIAKKFENTEEALHCMLSYLQSLETPIDNSMFDVIKRRQPQRN